MNQDPKEKKEKRNYLPQSRINNHKMQQHEDFKIRKVKQVNTFRDSASKIPIIDPN